MTCLGNVPEICLLFYVLYCLPVEVDRTEMDLVIANLYGDLIRFCQHKSEYKVILFFFLVKYQHDYMSNEQV